MANQRAGDDGPPAAAANGVQHAANKPEDRHSPLLRLGRREEFNALTKITTPKKAK